MDRIRRNERLAAMTRILVESPNKIFTLGTFCEMFGAAKSTLSEDIDILRGVFAQFHLGQLDTVTGAAGGGILPLDGLLLLPTRQRITRKAGVLFQALLI